jgi:cyanophycinase-like exopeptidase
MQRLFILFILIFLSFFSCGQNYTSYFTGDTADVNTLTNSFTVLMGGATENDSAMIRFLENSGGGDIVVLRASGSNGYNAYMYSHLGISVNSVQTIVCNNAAASYDPYVINQIRNAEALWFAGGDQWDFVSYWNNTPIDSAINYLINSKKIPVGGTSAGMAILGHIVNTAQNGSATSATSLANPYASTITLLKDDFIFNPWLNNVVTDTHYDNPDRRGRHFAFMARILQDYSISSVNGIACNEYVAVCIDSTGHATVYGDYPNYQEFAYFLQSNCNSPNSPETCISGQPLTWNRNSQAVKVYKVPGTPSGINSFELSDWDNGSGGTWEDWSVINGTLQTIASTSTPNCNLTTSIPASVIPGTSIIAFPNPVNNYLHIRSEDPFEISIYNLYAELIYNKTNCTINQLDVSGLISGYYSVIVKTRKGTSNLSFIKIKD